MSHLEANKKLATAFVDAMNRGDVDAVLESVHPELVNHAARPEAQGAAGLRIILGKIREAFPDARYQCRDVIAEGDRVVCRIRMTGTNTGPLRIVGPGAAATGKQVDTEIIRVFRVEAGRIVEHWAGRDDFGMMRQLGRSIAGGAS